MTDERIKALTVYRLVQNLKQADELLAEKRKEIAKLHRELIDKEKFWLDKCDGVERDGQREAYILLMINRGDNLS